MRYLSTILAALIFAAIAQAQTVKTLSYNTNGQFITGTNTLTFSNAIQFAGGDVQVTDGGMMRWAGSDRIELETYTLYGEWDFTEPESVRANLGLGASNVVTFAGLSNNGDITINNTTATNGLLFVYRTNNEPFLGLANLIASNNTTVSNETLFRVGRAEANNQSAQFGFRVVRTNNGGEGLAVFSVFGYNALMMIGPSDRSRSNSITNTNAAIEADIWTINQSNRVMTLRDTNTGALTMHRDLGFGAGLTNTAPTNTNTPAVWMRVWVGTNNYRLPLYQ
jgi:hypothetical protein